MSACARASRAKNRRQTPIFKNPLRPQRVAHGSEHALVRRQLEPSLLLYRAVVHADGKLSQPAFGESRLDSRLKFDERRYTGGVSAIRLSKFAMANDDLVHTGHLFKQVRFGFRGRARVCRTALDLPSVRARVGLRRAGVHGLRRRESCRARRTSSRRAVRPLNP